MTLIGINGRFFPNNWRPAAEEIAFAQQNEFAAVQFPGKAEGLGEAHLGSSLSHVAELLGSAGVVATMEQLIFVGANGKTKEGLTPFEFMTANLGAVQTLRCSHVHWHLAPAGEFSEREADDLEQHFMADLKQAADLAEDFGVVFGIEHNEPKRHLLATPESCLRILESVPNAGLVWDFNHTADDQVDGFRGLGDRIMGLHVSDTRLPSLNDHRPLGEGNLAYSDLCTFLRDLGFSGPAILEIGGQPHSGGYDQDTDAALVASARRLRRAMGLPVTDRSA